MSRIIQDRLVSFTHGAQAINISKARLRQLSSKGLVPGVEKIDGRDYVWLDKLKKWDKKRNKKAGRPFNGAD